MSRVIRGSAYTFMAVEPLNMYGTCTASRRSATRIRRSSSSLMRYGDSTAASGGRFAEPGVRCAGALATALVRVGIASTAHERVRERYYLAGFRRLPAGHGPGARQN